MSTSKDNYWASSSPDENTLVPWSSSLVHRELRERSYSRDLSRQTPVNLGTNVWNRVMPLLREAHDNLLCQAILAGLEGAFSVETRFDGTGRVTLTLEPLTHGMGFVLRPLQHTVWNTCQAL